MLTTLLQWNVSYNERIVDIAKFLGQEKPDIICLQELTHSYQRGHRDTAAYIAQYLDYHYYAAMGLMSLPDGGTAYMGVGIFSRFPIMATKEMVIQPGKTDGKTVLSDKRYYIECVFDMHGIKLGVGTVHLPFHPDFRTTSAKQTMVDMLVENLASTPRNYILAGDLNTTPRSAAITTLRQHLRNAGPPLSHKTWTTKPFTIGSHHYDELRYRLDYLLYKGNILPIRGETLETDLSDHLPLLLTMDVEHRY
jgi:endonuclease/exonuclease/phosphatase family metal-dependent hydrolase